MINLFLTTMQLISDCNLCSRLKQWVRLGFPVEMWFLSQSWPRQWKDSPSRPESSQRRRLKKNIAQATGDAAESRSHFRSFWGQKIVLIVNFWMFGNAAICGALGTGSAFSSIKSLSISQLCVKVLLDKNAQTIYQVFTNFGDYTCWIT